MAGGDNQGSSSSNRGNSNSRARGSSGEAAEEGFQVSQLRRAVAELEGLISDAALETASVTLRRAAAAAGEGADAFDLTPLQNIWLPWSEYERLYVQIN